MFDKKEKQLIRLVEVLALSALMQAKAGTVTQMAEIKKVKRRLI